MLKLPFLTTPPFNPPTLSQLVLRTIQFLFYIALQNIEYSQLHFHHSASLSDKNVCFVACAFA
jgi:hypothetical protein